MSATHSGNANSGELSLLPESSTSEQEGDRSVEDIQIMMESMRGEKVMRVVLQLRRLSQGCAVVNRRKNVKRSIDIIGDSMVRIITKVVKCGKTGSGCISRGGAGIKEIIERSVTTSKDIQDDGYLVSWLYKEEATV